eukprot:g21340.t1
MKGKFLAESQTETLEQMGVQDGTQLIAVVKPRINQSEAESLSFLPANEPQSSKVTDLKEKAFGTLQFFLHSDQWRQTMFKGSYYFSGKGFQKVAYTCLLLEKFYGLTHSHTQSCADILRRGFQCLYAPTTPECNGAPIGLYYDVAWHGVASREGFSDIGCRNADFGNACYNDHHYHFSYFVVSAAVLVKLKPEFSADHAFVSFVDTLIRDTTNPSSNDAHFPMFRSFDWFDLHSWSRGVIPSADGKDQESTSEELNLLYGVRLWGMVLQRESLQALGTTMLALCASTIREFFLMTQDNQHHPEDFVTNHVTGIFFQNKVDYATWFGWRYEFIHGIQMLPVTPALLMIRTPDFCRQEWDNILSGLPLSETDPWTSLLLAGTLAIIDPEAAYSRLSAMKPEHMDDGLTQLWALYWSASLSTADVPTTGSTITSSTTTSGATEENLALSRFAVASSESSPEHAAAHAVDGLFVTRWSPSLLDENPWISVDLGAVYALSHVVVFWGEFFPSSYLIQGKVTQWTTLAVAAGSSDLLRSNVPQPTFAQLVRIVSQSTGIDIRLWEFQVFLDADVTSTSSSSSSVTTSSMPISTSTTSLGTSPPTTTESGSTTTPFYGPNLALTKPVLASSFRSPTEHAYKAVDGDSNTQWASAPVNQQWLWVDLLGVYAVGQVVVIWGEEYSDFVLQTAPDGIKWTNVATVNGAPDRVGTVFSPAILAQWVRIQCQSACAMREFRIHGEVPESMTTSSTLATSSSSMSPTPSSTTSLQTGEVQSSTTLINSKVNLALLRPVLSSSQRLPTEHVSRMVDGSVDSQWASAETDAMPWAWVDLLGVHEVVEVAVHWGDDYAQVYELQASPNAVDWVSITTDSGSSGQIVQTTLPPNTQTQWIRIVCLSLSGSSCSIRELLVYEAHAAATVASTTGATTAAPVGENVAKEKPVLASSQILPFEHASKAVDGLAGTQWASASSDDQWIWIDLLGSYELDYVLLSWGNTLPSSYNLETSSNGVTWEVAVEDVQPTAPVERTDLPAGTRSQWLRVFCKSTNGCSIQELQVFGTPVSPVRLLRELRNSPGLLLLRVWHTYGIWVGACVYFIISANLMLAWYIDWYRTSVTCDGNERCMTSQLLDFPLAPFFAIFCRSWLMVCIVGDLLRFCFILARDVWEDDAFLTYRRVFCCDVQLGEEQASARASIGGWSKRTSGRCGSLDILLQLSIYVALDLFPLITFIVKYSGTGQLGEARIAE